VVGGAEPQEGGGLAPKCPDEAPGGAEGTVTITEKQQQKTKQKRCQPH